MRSRSEAAVIAGAASSFQLSSFPARNAKVSPIPMTTASRMPISEISFLFVSALLFRCFGSCAPMNIQKKTISKASSSADTGIPALREQLKECEKGIENMLNAIQAGVLTPSSKEQLDQLEARRSDLNVSIMQAELTRPKYTKLQIVEWISQFKHGDPNDLNYQKQIIDIFLNSIYVYDDRYVLTYNFHSGTETIPREAVEEAFGSDLTHLAPQTWEA